MSQHHSRGSSSFPAHNHCIPEGSPSELPLNSQTEERKERREESCDSACLIPSSHQRAWLLPAAGAPLCSSGSPQPPPPGAAAEQFWPATSDV